MHNTCKIYPDFRHDNILRNFRRWMLLGVVLSSLPFFFGIFSAYVIAASLLLGCAMFLDTLRIAAQPHKEPVLFVFIIALFQGSFRIWEPSNQVFLAYVFQSSGLIILASGGLNYYFRDVIAKIRAASLPANKEA